MFSLLLVFLLLSTHCSRFQRFHEVVIIGAGISGLRASQILTEERIPHIIIQSKDHIGGRIAPIIFDDIIVDHGSSFYQAEEENSSFMSAINAIKWPVQSASNDFKNLFFDSEKIELNQHEMAKVFQLQQKYADELARLKNSTKGDISIRKALKIIQRQKIHENEKRNNMIEHIAQFKASLRGSDLNRLSSKHFDISKEQRLFQPAGGMYKLFQKWFRAKLDIVHLNQRVLSLDYSDVFIKIKTNKGTYKAKRVISSLPLGVMKNKKVQFLPNLPARYELAINSIGNGIYNKLYVSFGKKFWGNKKGWLNFISSNKEEVYTTAFVQPNTQKNILIFHLSQKDSVEMSKFTEQQIKKDLKITLSDFFDQIDINIHDVLLTKWHLDENALGSFSSYKVGTTKQDFEQLSRAIDKKIWFVGEHTNPMRNGCVNGAYESGQRAAKQVAKLYKTKVYLQYVPAFGPYNTKVYQRNMSSRELQKMIRKFCRKNCSY